MKTFSLTANDPYAPIRLSFCRYVVPQLSESALKVYLLMLAECYQRVWAHGQPQWMFVEREFSVRYGAGWTDLSRNSVSGAINELLEWNLVARVREATRTDAAMYRLRFDIEIQVDEDGDVRVIEIRDGLIDDSDRPADEVAQNLSQGGSKSEPQVAQNLSHLTDTVERGGGSKSEPSSKEERKEEERRSLRATGPTSGEGGGNDDSSSLEGNPGGSGATATASAPRPDPTMRIATRSGADHIGTADAAPAAHHTRVTPDPDDDDDDIAPTPEMMQLVSYFRTRTTREPNAMSSSYQDKWLRPVAHLLKQCRNDVVVAKEIMGEAIDRANGRNSSNRAYTVATPASLVTWMNTLVAERLATSQAVTADDLWERAFDALINRTHDDLQLTKAIDVVGSRRILSATKADAPALKISLLNAYIAAGEAL